MGTISVAMSALTTGGLTPAGLMSSKPVEVLGLQIKLEKSKVPWTSGDTLSAAVDEAAGAGMGPRGTKDEDEGGGVLASVADSAALGGIRDGRGPGR